MPTFNITAPDGRKFRVTGDNAEGALAAVQGMNGGQQAPTPPPMDFQGRFDPMGQDAAPKGDRQPMAVAPQPQTEFAPRPAGEQPPGMLESVVSGAADMATLGFGDEIAGGVSSLFGGDYDKTVEGIRGRQQAAQEAHPIAFGAGQVAGAIPSAMLIPGSGGGMLARMGKGAAVGAGYGSAYGAGSAEGGVGERTLGALGGGAFGTVTGGIAPPVLAGLGAAARGIGQRVIAPIRGAINPQGEAARRVAVARQVDDSIPQPRLTPQDEAAAAQRGQPVLNIDRGGETTRAMARSAANVSPPGRAAMETAVNDRFTAQGDRTIDTVRRIVGNGTTADAREALQTAARAANRPAYARAYRDPAAQGVWDDELQNLADAPLVQDAIRQATVTGRNRGALDGLPPIRNPFQRDPQTGRLSLATDAQGNRILPNLQFWDHVKRNLDAVGTREAQQASRVLREHLDGIVPSYRNARAGAARFFGANDALEAGDQFVMSRMANDEARRALGQMSQAERQLFAEGFADSLVRRLAEVGDRRNVINSLFIRSRASRERIEMALGPRRARELESFLRVEDLLDRARTALSGNSTTTRQLVEAGLAGTTGVYGLATGDWRANGLVIAGILTRRGFGRIDRNVAQRVGELLASPDPAAVQRGVMMVAQSERLFNALRAADIPAAAVSGQRAGAYLANPSQSPPQTSQPALQ